MLAIESALMARHTSPSPAKNSRKVNSWHKKQGGLDLNKWGLRSSKLAYQDKKVKAVLCPFILRTCQPVLAIVKTKLYRIDV